MNRKLNRVVLLIHLSIILTLVFFSTAIKATASTNFRDMSLLELEKLAELPEIGKGIPEAQYEMGRRYLIGEGVPIDYGQTVKWYRKAAQQGHLAAQSELGGWLYKSPEAGLISDEAFKWCEIAAKRGDVGSQKMLASIYYRGERVAQNYNEAIKWYKTAGNQGDTASLFKLGVIYENGNGVPKDYEEAYIWYRKAADLAYAPAFISLGGLYARGAGTEKNYEEAIKLYKKAIAIGDESTKDKAQTYLKFLTDFINKQGAK